MKSFKGFKMILKNSSRNAIRSKSQLFNLTILTTIFALVLFLITQVSTRVWESYDNLKTTSNIHHGVVQLDPFDNVPTSEQMKDDETYKDVPRNNVEAQQYWIYQLQQYAKDSLGLDLVWSRTEAKEFSQQIWWDGEYALTLKVVAKTFSDYEGNNQDVDKLVIFEGHDIEHKQQVVLDPVFAKNHGIELGDVIRISKDSMGSQLLVNSKANLEQGTSEEQLKQLNDMVAQGDITSPENIYNAYYKTFNWLQVVGFGSSVDFSTPIVSTSPIPNRKTEALIYISPDQFGLKQKEKNIGSDNASDKLGLWEYDQASDNLVVNSNSEWESFYSLKFLNMNDSSQFTSELEAKLNDKFKGLIRKEGLSRNYVFSNSNKEYRFYNRLATIEQTLVFYNLAIAFILAIILVVVLYTTGLMTRKQIEKTRSQIGTLKALGYYKRILVFNYIMTPTITAILGGVLGFLLSLSVQNPIANKFAEYFVLDYGQLSFDWIGFLMIVMIWVVLTAVAFLIAYLIMRKDALGLLSTSVKGKVSKWGIFLKTLSAKRSFTGRLKTALLIDASGKMVAIGVVVFLATASITISFAAPDLLIRNQELSMKGLNYRQLIEYESPIYNNPYSFLKTYNIAASQAEKNDEGRKLFEWKDSVQATTALPTVEKGEAFDKGYGEGSTYTGYDVKKIAESLYNNEQTNEFYSIVLNGIGNGEVDPMDLSIANVRFLQGYGLTASVDFYKTISTYAVYDDTPMGIWKILSKQWPDVTNLYAEMKKLDESNESIIRGLQLMQNFYKEYVDAPALSITKAFYNSESTDDKLKDIIINFNQQDDNELGANGSWNKMHETNQGWAPFEMSAKLLKELNGDDVPLQMAFYANDKTQQYNFHIADPSWDDQTDNLEYYLTLQPNEFNMEDPNDNENAKMALKAYITWFGALFSHRPDQGVIQAAYSRSPYFVQQFFKKAALEEKVYSHGFGSVSIDPDKEALGTKVNVSNGETNFNLYGVDNTKQFKEMIHLTNTKNDLLFERLYDDNEFNNEIILNQSAAKKLKISEGETISLDVLQEALYDNNEQVKMEDWNDSEKEGNIKEEGFVPYTKMIPVTVIKILGQQLPSIHSASLNQTFMNESALDPEASGKYYDKVRAGTIYNDGVTNVHTEEPTEFKVVGIHDGYGEPQGWIKNSDAHDILGYNEFEEYMYKNQFIFQWGRDKSIQTIKGLPDELSKLKEDLNKEYGTIWGTSISGKDVYQMFQHEFPIFDYKYSQKEDVGDLEVTVQFFQQYGDYNPVTLNGNTKGIDGSGQGAMSLIMPTDMKEAILQQITDLSMMMIIFMNVFILAITFVIIFLTTSLIINDNVRFIATMKVLGYGNKYIAKSVLGMYFIVIAAMFVAAIGVGWFGFASIIKALPIVMPLAFPVWLVFAVALAVIGIYVVAISAGFRLIAKTNATLVLKEGDI